MRFDEFQGVVCVDGASASAGRFPIWKWVRIDLRLSLLISRAKESILGIRFVR